MATIKITTNDIKEFVSAAHSDLPKVQQMLTEKPLLLNAPNGNETALGAACQMKRKDIVEYLLAQGAPLDIYAACVLGLTEKVAAFLDADPTLATAKNRASHNKYLTSFATEQARSGRPIGRPGSKVMYKV